MAPATDDDTIRDASAGDSAAFSALLSPLLDPAFKLATLLLRDRAEAEDAVQEAALRAWTRLHQLRGDRDHLRSWFLTIVANQCKTMRRRAWWQVIKLPHLAKAQGSAEEAAVRDLDLRRAIERLDTADQFALAFYYLDLPLSEAAMVMGVPLSTAKSRIYRAVTRLRKDATLDEVLAI
ncbi:MAG: sigma-70 family RNA polymerase sigma factor [Candidatus Dormibacteraeota bacterium]|nr:sigma-70 family RNA polymerase sigma factor [Candidatus Dormibacteraeota bacterium]MDQ6917719.1 sigma-70 family RNA polymerase sigma factor [Candidatus Dormibacteraeota bacterium]